MSRKLRIFGIAALAIFALGAISAQAALAVPEFTSFNRNNGKVEAVSVTGTQTTPLEYTFSAGGMAIKCTTAGFSGTFAGQATTLSVTPSWANCTTNGGFNPVDVRVNGCKFEFSIIAKEVADVYSGQFAVKCDATKKIEFEVRTEDGLSRKCLDTIDPQMGITSVTYTDDTTPKPEDFTIKMGTTNLANTTDDEKAKCGVNQELHKDGAFVGTTTMQGSNAKPEGIDFTVIG